VSFSIIHLCGRVESNARREDIVTLIGEISSITRSYFHVALIQARGWTLQAHRKSRLVAVHPSERTGARHRRDVPRTEVPRLFVLLAGGEIESFERVAWKPGCA
jgi:hypothetical protein